MTFVVKKEQIENQKESSKVEIQSLVGQIKYCEDKISKGIEKWEEKEYVGVIDECLSKLMFHTRYLLSLEDGTAIVISD